MVTRRRLRSQTAAAAALPGETMYLDTSNPILPAPAAPAFPPGIVPLAAINATIARLQSAGLQPRPVLDPDALIARATRRTGLADFGQNRHWRPLLDTLVAALGTAGLSPLGEVVAESQLTDTLAARLRARAVWRANPEIAAVPITAPIVIIGQMRSGTTRLQRLLAADPRLDHTRLYESWLPVAADRPSRLDLRRARAAAWLAATRALNPGFGAIHPTGAAAPDEEIGLLGPTLCSSQFEVQWRVPAYARLCEAIDRTRVYAEFKALLQVTRWLRGGDHAAADRPWVLKVPQFTQDLAALLTAFPDARLLCLDRDTAATVASSASLVHNQMALQSAAVDPHWIGAEWLHKVALRQRTVRDVLAATGTPHLAIDYAAMDADWRGEMRRIHAFLGLTLPADVTARMADFLAGSHGRRRHRYDLAQFGLTPDSIRNQIAAA